MRVLSLSLLIVFSCLLISCETASEQNSKVQKKASNTDAIVHSGILVIEEDPPFSESMVNWRVKNAMMTSFTKGEKEAETLKSTIRSYEQPAEYAEKELLKTLKSSFSGDKDVKTISYKNKDKPDTTLKLMKEANVKEHYVLDIDINRWNLRPSQKDNFAFWLFLDMDMMLIDMQKEAVLVHQKCYFDEQDEAHSQYKIFKDDAELLNSIIKKKAAQCVDQFKNILKNKDIV